MFKEILHLFLMKHAYGQVGFCESLGQLACVAVTGLQIHKYLSSCRDVAGIGIPMPFH
jgi:hypothetical protein